MEPKAARRDESARHRHVLVVDDDARTLRAIRRVLHMRRAHWDVSLFTDAHRALDVLSRDRADVIVSDITMPGLDGPGFLGMCEARFPSIPRLALSGGAPEHLLLRTSAVAHRFLAKPLDSGVLVELLEEVLDIGDLVRDPVLRELLGVNGALPVLPEAARLVEEALADPGCTIRDVADIVQTDPGMSARMLQLVNSAFFGRRHDTASVLQAVGFLGIRRVRALVLALGIFDALHVDDLPEELQVSGLGVRCLTVATLAHRLMADPEADVAFTAGLLHDVGWLAAFHAVPERAHQLVEAIRLGECEDIADEPAFLGASHQDMGAYLLALWGLDGRLVQAARYHHRPEAAPHSTFAPVDAVHVALSLLGGYGVERAWCLSLHEDHVAALGMLERLPEWTAAAEALHGGH